MRRCHLTEGVVHTAVERQRIVAHGVVVACLHIERCAKRSRTIGRCTHAALHIDARHRGRHIGHVHPKHRLALLVVERDIVHRHVDTRVVRTPHTKVGVAHTQAVVARNLQRRHGREQIGHVLSRIVAVQFLFAYHLVVDSGLLYSLRNHLNFIELMVLRNR